MQLKNRKGKTKNAKKSAYYKKALEEAERLDFELAAGVEGIDDEITLLRTRIKAVLRTHPENAELIVKLTNSLARLVKMRYNMTKDQKNSLKEAITNVIKDIAVPLGVAYIKKE